MRALAVTTAKRSASLPDVPAIGESVPGFEVNTWQGIGAPKGTPAAIVARSTRRSTRRWPTPRSRRAWRRLGSEPAADVAGAFEKLIVDETAKWAKVIHEANIPLQ